MPPLVVVCKRKGDGRGGKLGKAGSAVQGGALCRVQTCVAARAVGSVPFTLSKDIPVGCGSEAALCLSVQTLWHLC